MFQYAVARSLSIKHETQLFYDNSYYLAHGENSLPPGAAPRKYELDMFMIQADEILNYKDMILKRVRSRRIHKKILAIVPCVILNTLMSKTYLLNYLEKGPQYDKSVLKLPNNIVLDGYFVSYKYFNTCAEVIKKDFTFKHKPDKTNITFIKDIERENTVGIHIRRGDYITNTIVRDKFGVCELDYYRRSIDYMSSRLDNPLFVVFSDDFEWVRNNFKMGGNFKYATHNVGIRDFEDLRLMSLCKHNIIANSTFSWWAAWLNPNPHKIVVCPSPAFDKLNISDDDFYPCEWVRLQRV
jgi:hypothetical protein